MILATTYFGLLVAQSLLGLCKDLAVKLQDTKITHTGTHQAVFILLGQLQAMQREDFLDDLWKKAAKAGRDLKLEEPAPRRVRKPTEKAKDNGAEEEIPQTTRERSLKEAKEAIAAVQLEVNDRFTSEGFLFVLKAEKVLISAGKGEVLQ